MELDTPCCALSALCCSSASLRTLVRSLHEAGACSGTARLGAALRCCHSISQSIYIWSFYDR